MSQIAFILPIYGKYDFARRCAISFFEFSPPDSFCVIVDDASPDFNRESVAWLRELPKDRFEFFRFETRGGLTRSWNWGLIQADRLGAEYACPGNSDLLFTEGWHIPLIHHLSHSFDLVGPITNAPGWRRDPLGEQRQNAFYYDPNYAASDSPEDLAAAATFFRQKYPIDVVFESAINGFFMMAKTAVWKSGAFDAAHVFNPSFPLVGNEDELQERWRRMNRRIGHAPSSFVFHYRAISRGDQYRCDGAFRSEGVVASRKFEIPDFCGVSQPYIPTYGQVVSYVNDAHRHYAECPLINELIDEGISGWLRREDALKLYELAFFSEGDVLELGCGHGLSTSIIAQAITDAAKRNSVLSVDLNPNHVSDAVANLKKRRLDDRVKVECGNAATYCEKLVKEGERFAFAFIDHAHDYRAVLAVCRQLANLIVEGGYCLFHDFNDVRNSDPGQSDYGVLQAVRDGLSPSKFEFCGVYGCTGLFKRASKAEG